VWQENRRLFAQFSLDAFGQELEDLHLPFMPINIGLQADIVSNRCTAESVSLKKDSAESGLFAAATKAPDVQLARSIISQEQDMFVEPARF